MKFFKIGKLIISCKRGEGPLTDCTNHNHYYHHIPKKQDEVNGKNRGSWDNTTCSCGSRLSSDSSSNAIQDLMNKEVHILSSFDSSRNKEKMIEGLSGRSSLSSSSWKWAIDQETKRRYYYNKVTKEVTWLKPKTCNEWRVYSDRNTNKCYYYNILTKETTWEKPADIVNDPSNSEKNPNDERNNCSTESRTQTIYEESTTVASKENDVQDVNVKIDRDLNNESITQDNGIHSDHWKAYFDYTNGKHFFYNFNTREKTWTKPKDFQEWIAVVSSSDNELYYYNVLTGVSTWMRPSSIEDGSSEAPPTDSEESIAEIQNLTLKYCPDEIHYAERLIRKFRGRESIPLQALQTFTSHNAPFDEKNLAVTSFVKAAVTPVGAEPYDEMVEQFAGCKISAMPLNESRQRIAKSYGYENTHHAPAAVTSPELSCKSRKVLSTSAHSRYLSKPIQIVGSGGRTASYMYR